MGCFSSKDKDGERGGRDYGPGPSMRGGGKDAFGFGLIFEPVKELGRGIEGVTWLMRDKRDGREVAVKLLKRGDLPPPEYVVREIDNQCNLRMHPCIVDLQEAILGPTHLAMVMEYVKGGSMLDLLDREPGTKLSENRALYYFKSLIAGVSFMHSRKVAHRDIKLENIFLTKDDPPRVKMGDFGFSRQWKANETANMYTQVGTSPYMSPELLKISTGNGDGLAGASDEHDPNAPAYNAEQADIWACGVVLYVMLVGRMPYEGSSVDTVHRNVASGRNKPLTGARIPQKTCSPECRELLNGILTLEQDEEADAPSTSAGAGREGEVPTAKRTTKRFTIPEIINHPWFLKELPPPFDGDPLDPFPKEATPGSIGPPIPESAFQIEQSLQRLVTDAVRRPAAGEFKKLSIWRPPKHIGFKYTGAFTSEEVRKSISRSSSVVLQRRPSSGPKLKASTGPKPSLPGAVSLGFSAPKKEKEETGGF